MGDCRCLLGLVGDEEQQQDEEEDKEEEEENKEGRKRWRGCKRLSRKGTMRGNRHKRINDTLQQPPKDRIIYRI